MGKEDVFSTPYECGALSESDSLMVKVSEIFSSSSVYWHFTIMKVKNWRQVSPTKEKISPMNRKMRG